MTALVYVQASAGLIPLPSHLDPIALRLIGWDKVASQIEESQKSTGAAFVAADGYALASELAWWLPPAIQVVGADQRWTLTTLPVASIAGAQGLLVRDDRRFDPPDATKWTDVQRIATARRPNMPDPGFAVYRVVAVSGGVPGVTLPHR